MIATKEIFDAAASEGAWRNPDHVRLAKAASMIADLRGELKRVTDHLECFVRDHGEDRTADIDAAIFCARQLLNR